MIKNYFKIAWRNLWKNKTYSFITISGLSLAMAGAILLLLWIQNALSVDQFHAKKDMLYKVYTKQKIDGYIQTKDVSSFDVAPDLLSSYPEVKQASRVLAASNSIVYRDKKLYAKGNFVDAAFLTMFSFPLKSGNPAVVLKDRYSIVITEQLADKIFAEADPMNKSVVLDSIGYTVTGVLKDLPNNTQFNFEYLIPINASETVGMDASGRTEALTFVALDPLADETVVNKRIKGIAGKHGENGIPSETFLYPFTKTWLYGDFEDGKPTGGGITIVRLLSVVAFIILLIGSINFMNLSTAKAEQRAKEVGVRKAIGAGKSSLIKQFIGESILLAFVAGLIGLLLAQLILPSFNQLTEKQLLIPYKEFPFWIAAFCFVLFTGFLAGSYPAFYLSSFKSVDCLKNKTGNKYSMRSPRNILVVVQFVVAVVLTNYSYMIIKQTTFMMHRETGFLKNELVFLPMTTELKKNYDVVKQVLLNSKNVLAVNTTNVPITSGVAVTNHLKYKGLEMAQPFKLITSNTDFVHTHGLQLTKGRDLDLNAFPMDTASCLINETAAKQFGDKDIMSLVLEENGTTCSVVGVLKDYVNDFPGHEDQPLIVRAAHTGAFTNIRLTKGISSSETIAVNDILKKYNAGNATELQFARDDYEQKFKGARVSITLAVIFSLVTIFISCLGLLGLALFTVSRRTKEIGIRKIMGARTGELTFLLTRDFIKLVLIAVVAGSPIGWQLMKTTVQNFSYRTNIDWWIFLATGGLLMLVTAITVSFQTVKAAAINPVESLRTE
jgi:ABC-type antimicrobial peptide transport system permease subunit